MMYDKHVAGESAIGMPAPAHAPRSASRPRPAASTFTPATPSDAVRILGVPFSPVSYDEAAQRIRAWLHDGASHHVVLANAHTLNNAYEDHSYRHALAGASLVLRDGVGVELAALLAGRRLEHNFVGTDFVPHLLASLADLSVGVFLYGAAPGVAVAAGRALQQRCPGIRVVGTEHGYVEPTTVLNTIRAAQPDILLVALGNPLQETWIASHLEHLNAGVAIGVGALFDYLADRVARAPRWVRALRCEWLFRLVVEPARLWRRYLVGNPMFLWRVAFASRKEMA